MSGHVRVRVRFTKLGKIRWTSHRDVARMWERAFRRVRLPLAYSEGFSPRPKVSFGLALPTGHESLAEYLDVELSTDSLPTGDLLSELSGALPSGVDAVALAPLAPGSPSLQEAVTSCTWEWTVLAAVGAKCDPQEIGQRAAALLASPSMVLTRTRKGREQTEDLRDTVLSLDLIGPLPCAGVLLRAELASQPRSLRPGELTLALGPDLEERDTRRLHQWTSRDGARREPLQGLAAATDAPGALERAS